MPVSDLGLMRLDSFCFCPSGSQLLYKKVQARLFNDERTWTERERVRGHVQEN